MKKVLLISFVVVTFLSCNTNDKPKYEYSDAQKKAFAVLIGLYADINKSNLSGGSLSQYLPPPEKISFTKIYDEPLGIYKEDYINGKEWLFDAHGECTYYSHNYTTKNYDIYDCYFTVSRVVDKLYIYTKSNNLRYNNDYYFIDIISDNKFTLDDGDYLNPYIFVKQ